MFYYISFRIKVIELQSLKLDVLRRLYYLYQQLFVKNIHSFMNFIIFISITKITLRWVVRLCAGGIRTYNEPCMGSIMDEGIQFVSL